MYEYKNPMYEPRIHDFGDSYHLPDVKTDDETESLLVRVKKIRRRYTNWFDYTDACRLYDRVLTDEEIAENCETTVAYREQ